MRPFLTDHLCFRSAIKALRFFSIVLFFSFTEKKVHQKLQLRRRQREGAVAAWALTSTITLISIQCLQVCVFVRARAVTELIKTLRTAAARPDQDRQPSRNTGTEPMIFLFRNVGNGKAAEPEQSGTIRYQGRFFSVVWVLRASPCRIRQFCQCHCPSSHFHSCPHSDTIGRFGGFTCLFVFNQEVNSFIFGHICIFNFLFFSIKKRRVDARLISSISIPHHHLHIAFASLTSSRSTSQQHSLRKKMHFIHFIMHPVVFFFSSVFFFFFLHLHVQYLQPTDGGAVRLHS